MTPPPACAGDWRTRLPADLQIRRGVPADAQRLTEIARVAKAHWGYPEAWLSVWKPALTITSGYLRHQLVHVGTIGKAPVGFYALEPRGEQWSLEHFWVEPGWHGRGVGRQLFAHALDRVRALRPGVLVIHADPYAAGFYVRMGARRKGTVSAPVEEDRDRTLPVFEIDLRPLA
ncbi:MAG: GNAT family N-acetyltransferase [Candidatus Rokuibacteriota bacterium]|nr:MAG: GNAT family N-acetyltransferase [Candidatus Rokubacteria bacterium]PYN75909.1 MAG: GNAT family N-acetyltransferase [Candidatus Rokubacteria bacterium]